MFSIFSQHRAAIAAASLIASLAAPARGAELQSGRYLAAVGRFADVVVEHGRDQYGQKKTPLFVDGLHAETLEPARWQHSGETWVLSNFASQQPLVRLLDGWTALGGEPKYRAAAEEAARYALGHLQSPSGLLYWGGHLAWDLDADKPVGQGTDTHELKGHQPYYELMWRVDPKATRQLLEAVWAGHILDWSLLDYNRHASVKSPLRPQWDHPFNESVAVPFPAKGGNLSFANVTPPLVHCGTVLAVEGADADALRWTRRLVYRWQQGKDLKTGLCGGQLSYRAEDRAQEALGHVHPTINEAKIVASYHQISRYHHLPLVQMQAAEALVAAGGEAAEVGREFLRWASDDLEIYARECFDSASGDFLARMTDGTAIRWRESQSGYYVPESFAPVKPDGDLFWSYAMAYRLTGGESHWRMARTIAAAMDLGDLGEAGGKEALRQDTPNGDWQAIYALLELHRASGDEALLRLACRVGDNVLKMQSASGLFPRPGRVYARTGDEAPLALLHLAATIDGRQSLLPRPIYDSRFFHCVYDGPLEPHQQKRADARTYDHLVFYGGS
jgi:pectate lyase